MKNSTNNILDQREADHAINNYTRVPNMLVDGYPDLHPQDKWLFVCLVRLCGKEGTRYLSLRYIADRTGFSRGPLGGSKEKPGMIQRLHNAGLIHAEIKRRKSTDGNEKNNAQYHITIADTWKLNYDFFHPETCPDSGQDISEPVLNQDTTRPKTGQDTRQPVLKQDATCPDSEPTVRLQNKITESNKITERKNGTPTVSAKQEATHSSIHSSSPSFQNSFSSSQGKQEEEVTLSEQEQVIYEYACQTIFKAKPPHRTAKLKGECAEIAKHVQTVEQFISLVQFVRALPYIQGQIHLKNLANELNGWLQAQQWPGISAASKGVTLSSYDDDDYVDDTFYAPKVSDAQIAEKIAYFSTHFGDTANVEENQRKAVELQRGLGVSRENFYDCLFDAQVMADKRGSTMAVFFEQLRLIVTEKKAQALAS